MVTEGFSLSAYIAIPVVLSLLLEGDNVKVSVIKNVSQESIEQQAIAPSPQLISTKTAGKTYYVSGKGNDKNNGLSTSSPFRTIQKAANLTKPGDTVLIMNGVYTNANPKGEVVAITRSGTANAWIKFKAYPGHSPKLQHDGWHGVLINNGASYIEVNGLEVIGNNANVTLDYAMSQKSNKSNPLTNGNCITVDGRKKGHPHHIRIVNNKTHSCGGSGIGVIEADYVTIDNNVVFDNAWYGIYASSGISLLRNWNFDNYQGYKIFVTNNKVYNNRQYIPWIKTGTITDGNGVILDSFTKEKNSTYPPYKGRTLVKNNLTFHNGGSGIHTFNSDRIDIINNTAFLNNQTPELKLGQIFTQASSDVKILNNILYAFPGKNVNSKSKGKNVIFDYNIYLNTSSPNVKGPHDIIADADFIRTHPTLRKIAGDWNSQLSKQNLSAPNSIKLDSTSVVCEPVSYTLRGKLIKVGCSR
ncbi:MULTISPECIES: right-handed parallel beta-helix repeat-containing protein [Nostoc]|uniref:Right-handed parallel beta-helix repeat-containing protein n=1 Tax=Nostoc paludosum FACHB-159 TaxID=2692908 RepID=A0ABR8K6R0_9NOSO|nr:MULTISPECIES: right-handed parallel beta-helix repeat-containing protein [Nostoc]MBD2677807.1 right-handed parallel beta-helix repeat-containing protein [Nostoc sp. FACHB-857]MBD2734018.1 right-handed parallel beta-helix repeat-containing protein [Nostoc paludosum FACHB-159]